MKPTLPLALLIALLTTGCATVESPGAPGLERSLISADVGSNDVQERIATSFAEIGKPLARRNDHSHVDWAGVLGVTRERVRAWPVLRSLRAVRPQTFDHMAVAIEHDQIALTYSTRF